MAKEMTRNCYYFYHHHHHHPLIWYQTLYTMSSPATVLLHEPCLFFLFFFTSTTCILKVDTEREKRAGPGLFTWEVICLGKRSKHWWEAVCFIIVKEVKFADATKSTILQLAGCQVLQRQICFFLYFPVLLSAPPLPMPGNLHSCILSCFF